MRVTLSLSTVHAHSRFKNCSSAKLILRIRQVEDGGYGWRHETFAAVVQPYLVNGLVHFLPPGTYNNFTSRSILRVTAPDCFHYNQFGNAIGLIASIFGRAFSKSVDCAD